MRELQELKTIGTLEQLTQRANDLILNCNDLHKQGYSIKSAEMKEQLEQLKETIEWINDRLSSGFYAFSEMLEELRALKNVLGTMERSLRIGAN